MTSTAITIAHHRKHANHPLAPRERPRRAGRLHRAGRMRETHDPSGTPETARTRSGGA